MPLSFRGIGLTSQRTRSRLVDRLRQEGIGDERVLSVLAELPRHIFVDEALAGRAYENTALPIGFGQTISQPYVVARMTECVLGPPSSDKIPAKILEVGTGCGYQTAVLGKLAEQVFSIERIGDLAAKARERLYALGLNNIHIRHGDGTEGWPAHAPYQGILVAAAPSEVPDALRRQLAPNGRLVIPVGEVRGIQRLLLITRTGERHGEEYTEEVIEHVTFVPMGVGLR